MENNLTVTCPQCKKVFSAKDLLEDHLKEKDKEITELLKKQQLEFKKKESEIEKNLKDQFKKNNEIEIKKQLEERAEKLKIQILNENKKTQEENNKQIKLLSKQLNDQEK